MKILCVCEQGVNRSVTLAFVLRYRGHDVLTCGLETNDVETVAMLHGWADKVIVTDHGQVAHFDHYSVAKVELWDLGPDRYPRPFNKMLLRKCRKLVAGHAAELEPVEEQLA